MLDLLECESERRGSNCSTIELFRKALHLAPALSSSFRTCLVVGIQLGGLGHVEEGLGEEFSDFTHLMNGFVAEHVDFVPISGAICK